MNHNYGLFAEGNSSDREVWDAESSPPRWRTKEDLNREYRAGVQAVLRQGEPPHTQDEIIAGMTEVDFDFASRVRHANNLQEAHHHMVQADHERIYNQLQRGIITNNPFPRRQA